MTASVAMAANFADHHIDRSRAMESLFNRYFWLIRMLGVSACVALGASAAVHYLAARFLLDDSILERVEASEAARPVLAPAKVSEATGLHDQAPAEIDAGLFCPTCLPVEPIEEEPEPSDDSDERGEAPMGPSKLPLQLVSTMVASDPDYSMAVLAHLQARVAAPYRAGDVVVEDVWVVEVTTDRVVLMNGGRREFIDIHGKNCSEDYPCQEGMGACDSDIECGSGLVCGEHLGGLYNLPASDKVCVPAACSPNPGRLNSRTFCTTQCRCASGKGDCDESAECLPGHMCAEDVGPRFGLPSNWDMCLADHCTNGVKDVDETDIDCGGKECGNCNALH